MTTPEHEAFRAKRLTDALADYHLDGYFTGNLRRDDGNLEVIGAHWAGWINDTHTSASGPFAPPVQAAANAEAAFSMIMGGVLYPLVLST